MKIKNFKNLIFFLSSKDLLKTSFSTALALAKYLPAQQSTGKNKKNVMTITIIITIIIIVFTPLVLPPPLI